MVSIKCVRLALSRLDTDSIPRAAFQKRFVERLMERVPRLQVRLTQQAGDVFPGIDGITGLD